MLHAIDFAFLDFFRSVFLFLLSFAAMASKCIPICFLCCLGQALTLEIEEMLFDQKSEYQHVVVFRSKSHGIVLVLDGA